MISREKIFAKEVSDRNYARVFSRKYLFKNQLLQRYAENG